jgi:hypothetical protein
LAFSRSGTRKTVLDPDAPFRCEPVWTDLRMDSWPRELYPVR